MRDPVRDLAKACGKLRTRFRGNRPGGRLRRKRDCVAGLDGTVEPAAFATRDEMQKPHEQHLLERFLVAFCQKLREPWAFALILQGIGGGPQAVHDPVAYEHLRRRAQKKIEQDHERHGHARHFPGGKQALVTDLPDRNVRHQRHDERDDQPDDRRLFSQRGGRTEKQEDVGGEEHDRQPQGRAVDAHVDDRDHDQHHQRRKAYQADAKQASS